MKTIHIAEMIAQDDYNKARIDESLRRTNRLKTEAGEQERILWPAQWAQELGEKLRVLANERREEITIGIGISAESAGGFAVTRWQRDIS